jgi:glycosyltransferase involved in cell wall biosynthesis
MTRTLSSSVAPEPGRAEHLGGGARSSAPPVPIAVIANANAPYRVATHRYVAARLPEVKIWSVFTHGGTDQAWNIGASPDFHPVHFGEGESVHEQTKSVRQMHEWRKGARVFEWIRTQGVRAVIVAGYNDLGRIRLFRLCKEHKIPCFLSADSNVRGDVNKPGLRKRAKTFVIKDVLAHVSGVLPMGTNGVEYFERYGAPASRMFFFPLIPDLDRPHPAPERVQQVARELGLAPGRRRLVYSGRLIPLKRVDMILDAFAAIADQRPEWDLLIIGDGPLSGELRARVPSRLAPRVVWAGFIADQDRIQAAYNACDALVLASNWEQWSLVVIEAVAEGLAVVSSDVVGVARDVVRDGVNGRLFRSENLPALVDALTDVTRPDRLPSMKEASPRIIREWTDRFDPARGVREALRSVGVLA